MNIFTWLFNRKSGSTPSVIVKHRNWDTSMKEFEIVSKWYRWKKETRELIRNPIWMHVRYYKTIEAANDAIKDFRHINSRRFEHNYPIWGEVIEYKRYKIIKRNNIKN